MQCINNSWCIFIFLSPRVDNYLFMFGASFTRSPCAPNLFCLQIGGWRLQKICYSICSLCISKTEHLQLKFNFSSFMIASSWSGSIMLRQLPQPRISLIHTGKKLSVRVHTGLARTYEINPPEVSNWRFRAVNHDIWRRLNEGTIKVSIKLDLGLGSFDLTSFDPWRCGLGGGGSAIKRGAALSYRWTMEEEGCGGEDRKRWGRRGIWFCIAG